MGELMTDIPISLSQVTADWLEQQFHDAGHDISGIIGFNHAPMEGFTGAMGEVGIFTIQWQEGSDPNLPESFVAGNARSMMISPGYITKLCNTTFENQGSTQI